VRHRRSTKQRVWLGSGRYPCRCQRRIANSDSDSDSNGNAYGYSNANRDRDGDSYSYSYSNARTQDCADTKASSHTRAQTVAVFAKANIAAAIGDG